MPSLHQQDGVKESYKMFTYLNVIGEFNIWQLFVTKLNKIVKSPCLVGFSPRDIIHEAVGETAISLI